MEHDYENVINDRILKFIRKHHVMTLATMSEKGAWVCSLFYAFDGQSLIFTSDSKTRHIQEGHDKQVAVNIVLESKIIGNLQGAQIVGALKQGDNNDKVLFLKRFPYAIADLKEVWKVEIEGVKFTDNKLGFGKKLFFGTLK